MNHGELDCHGKCTIFRVAVYLFELAFDTVIVESIMHSDILNYTKLPFNSLKMIQNDTVYQPIKQGLIKQGFNRVGGVVARSDCPRCGACSLSVGPTAIQRGDCNQEVRGMLGDNS